MKLTLATNIGAKDAKRLGLKETLRGKSVDVKDNDTAELMLRNGWAIRGDGKDADADEDDSPVDKHPIPAAKDGGGGGNADFNPLTDADRRRVAKQNREGDAEVIREAAAAAATPVRVVKDETKGAKGK